jgi:acyl-CoA synthetase (AMP-forming)/AMP-acid ligase II
MPCNNRASLRSRTLQVAAPADRFISDDGTRINLSDLRTGASLDPTAAHDRSILVKTTKQLPTVLALLELDGVARRVVLCPPDQWHHVPSIIETAGINILASDEQCEWVSTLSTTCMLDHPVRYDNGIETEWILLTSGTTGRPKMVIHTLASLAGPLEDGVVATDAVWATFYDVRRYGGLQILLRALLGGGSMILSDANESPADFLIRLGRCGVTHISGTPSHWRRALMSAAATAMTPGYVRLSGEVADQAILDSLHRTYPQAELAHAFATTEAGVGFDVRDGKAGFDVSLIGRPNLKAELKVEGGTLHIRSARAASGYIGKPLTTVDGFVDTGDLVERRGDRYYFTGRKEGMINVGGQKVYPEEVEAIITQHPAIQMARVWGRKSPITGSLVAVDILLGDPTLTLADIINEVIELCRSHLAAWKVPVSVRQVATIELNPAGKVARHA